MAPKSRGKKAIETPAVIEKATASESRGSVADASAPEQIQPQWKVIGSAIAIMVLAGLASPVSQANLSPVYGSIPSAIYHHQGVTIVTMLAFVISKLPLQNYLPSDLAKLLPVMAYYIPTIQWALFPYSKQLGAENGPLVTEALTFFPLLLLAYLATASLLESLDPQSPIRTSTDSIRPAICYGIFFVSQRYASSFLPTIIGQVDFFSRTGLSLVIATGYMLLARSPWLLLCSPAMLHTLFQNPHHESVATLKLLNKTLATHNYSLLDRRDSITGYVSVLEDKVNQYRVLRCDHSLLGGEWLVSEERATQGQVQRETIYSVFTMLEAARLVERDSARADIEANALFIGLGIGTSPTAFINRGINTTIVELDAVVHEFATKYFDLPTTHTAVLSDAVDFVSSASLTNPKSYDYIVHDVFTGGAEPTALFTLEFLQGLEKLLNDDGVVAINYAGDITLPPPRIVLSTIHKVFPTCRIFRDSEPDPKDPDPSNFINMVVFCTKSKTRPLTFRAAKEDDWGGSLSRREYVPPKKELEIKLQDIVEASGGDGAKEVILTRGKEGIIEKFHRDHAVRHWGLMRTVLPDAIWETW